jgi:5'-3' exonuclease
MEQGNTTHSHELVLIDLSSIAYPIWHMSQADPDANKTSQSVVARVRALANGHPHVAICCDSGRSFRRELAPSYKANRPEHDATLQHQITLASEQLAADGFPIWAVKSFEADDLIATAATKTLTMDGKSVLIVSADKDLLQLVGPRVQYLRAKDGERLDAEGVAAKFGVWPEQIRDYLTLVGDASDNIKGAKGIGPVKACELLKAYGSIDGIYEALRKTPTQFKPACATALREFATKPAPDAPSPLEVARALVTLRTDVDLPFDEILHERVVREAAAFDPTLDVDADDTDVDDAPGGPAAHLVSGAPPSAPSVPNGGDSGHSTSTAVVVREPDILPVPADYERQLDPRSMKDARILAKDMHDSRLFSAYGTPQGVLSTVMLGRELGLPAMASLRGIHIIEGRHALSAQTMVALVLKSGLAEYFEPVEFDAEHAIFETQRKGARKPVRMEHTIDMARVAGLVKPNSNWIKVPTDMLVARAQSRLARLVYPDVVGGLYTPDELAEIREQVA